MKYLFLILTSIGVSGFTYCQNLITGEIPKNEIVYSCDPCGCENDGNYFDSMGACPSCSMTLNVSYPGIESQMPANRRLTAGMLLFDHADIMDVTGPWSVLVHNGVRVVSFAKSKDPVMIGMSMELKPDFTLDNLPEVDILIFPGSGLAESNPADKQIQEFIKERKSSTKVLFSVCSGAFFLAEAGILDGKEATTFASLIPRLRTNYPKIKVLDNVKYTDNGQVVTTAGLSSGIDGTFYVISKFRGEGPVQDVANHMEYPWARSTEYARTQLADNFIAGLKGIVEIFAKKYISSNGNMDTWEYKYLLSGQVPSKDVLMLLQKQLQKTGSWKLLENSNTSFKGIINNSAIGRGNVTVTVENSNGGEVLLIQAARVEKYVLTRAER